MQINMKFVCCSSYDFVNHETGERVQGISCSCFDESQNKIIKVKTTKMLNYKFGDDVVVNAVPNGKYISYEIV